MGSLGLPELIIVAVIALLVFGPKKLPELGAGLGKSIKDFKAAMSGKDDEETKPPQKEDEKEKEKVTTGKDK